jgi:penicillin V acylase-like amidase (Ntn superfamily)
MKRLLLILVLIVVRVPDAISCTTFCMSDHGFVIFGRNYDWDIGNGLLMINKRNVSKTSMPQNGEVCARWVSKYGSLTFNQYGREFPTGGINERGLVVELLMLQESQYPAHDLRPVVDCLEWIQYQLDRSDSITDLLRNSKKIRISSSVRLHYLVCERSGACLTVEFLNGQFVPHYGSSLPVSALTNDTYENSAAYLRTLADFGGSLSPGSGASSLERFGRTATMMKNFSGTKDLVSYGFDILNNVAQGDYTKWNIVYDLTNLRAYFRTSSKKDIKWINLETLDFDCDKPVRVLNINTSKTGDVSPFLHKYRRATNNKLVRSSFKNTPFLIHTPDSVLQEIVLHPETFACVQN